MVWTLYYLIMYLMVAGIRISTIWNRKSKQWVDGRKNWQRKLEQLSSKKNIRIWFHVSSLGEFEQARPVIQSLKAIKPDCDILLTFYSPSGYELRSDYSHATVMYLPADLPGVAKKWISILKPDVAVFVKYDLWPGYLNALIRNAIPTFLISAHWIPGGWFSSWALPPTRGLLKQFKQIYLQKADHIDYFKRKGFTNVHVAGDTRIDRSLELASEASTKIPHWLLHAAPFDVIAGSTWPGDEKILVDVIQQLNLSTIIAPHDVSSSNINRVLEMLPHGTKKLSELNDGVEVPRVLLIDNIGLLSVLYSLGKMAYIGGGFGSGIHNILEPMAHAKPVIFGPAFKKFPEAVAMVEQEAAWCVTDGAGLHKRITFLLRGTEAEKAGKLGYNYLKTHSGATTIVTNSILESIPYGGVI